MLPPRDSISRPTNRVSSMAGGNDTTRPIIYEDINLDSELVNFLETPVTSTDIDQNHE
jgi:hypothetical protein